jgi:hypothetical protein
MSFALQYKPLIESETSVSKTLVLPRNVYRINSYKYSDGKQKTLSGTTSTIVFVVGKTTDKKLSCIKISEIKPEKFFKWLEKLYIKGLTEENWTKAEKLEDLLIEADVKGSKVFNSFVRPDAIIYGDNPNIYRTYSLTGIKQIEEVKFKKDVLKSYYK